MTFSQYTNKKSDEVLKGLDVARGGLSDKEAEERLKLYGPNEVKTKRVGLFDVLFRQFKSPFFYLLFIAALVAFIAREMVDGFVILFLVAVNVLLGFLQEARAEHAALLLKKYFPQKVRVLRQDKVKLVDKASLVLGDIVLLEEGNIVPADLRLCKIKNFLVDESVLTGESVSVPKVTHALPGKISEIFQAQNIAFAGTVVISGQAKGIVIGAGAEMVLGEITKLVSSIKRESVYEKSILRFAKVILRIVVVTIIAIFLANLIIKGSTNFFDFVIFCIALIVSILPEALPLIVTFALSNGALKLAKEKVVVKRLSALEDLGNMEILCTDKTGTLTEGRLKLDRVESKDKNQCLLYGLFTSDYTKKEMGAGQNPFDLALYQSAPAKTRALIKKAKVITEIPFNPFRLRNSALVQSPRGKRMLIVKGAPEIILKLSSKIEGGGDKKAIREAVAAAGRSGRRTLAVAYKEFERNTFYQKDEKNFTFLGFFSFVDPLKKTAFDAIRLAEKLEVQIKILTGDSPEVAAKVAQEVGLIEDVKQVITGEKLDAMSPKDFEKGCNESSVFARVSPTTKYKIIRALQEKYEVGFLGEGINDAPALKASNLAMVVASAADISQEASDILLLKKDLKVIINGIRQGRNIFSNINKYIKCTLASNFGNFYSIAIISLFIPFLPMLPVQIILVNILSDFPLITVASDKVDVEELRKPKLYQLNKVVILIILLALVNALADLILFGIFYKAAPSLLQTLWFIESTLTEIAFIFSIRTAHFFARAKRPSRPLIIASIITALFTIFLPFTGLGQRVFHFAAPPLKYLLVLLFLLVGYFVTSELVKLIYFRYWRRNNQH